MLEVFPMDKEEELIREQDLRSRFLLPILQGLFNSETVDESCTFRLNGENNKEYKVSQYSISHRQPDGSIILKGRGRPSVTLK